MTTLVAPAELRFRAMGSDVNVLVNGPAAAQRGSRRFAASTIWVAV